MHEIVVKNSLTTEYCVILKFMQGFFFLAKRDSEW